MPVISFDTEYTYELQVQTSNINYNGLDTIVSFNNNAILSEYENGVLIATYKGNTNIVNFLKSKNARVIGHNDWEIGNINVKENETFFKKDETIILAYSFFVNEIIGGTSIRSQKIIEQKINVSYYVPSVSQSISSSDNPLHLFVSQKVLSANDFEIKIEYHANANGNHSVMVVPYEIGSYGKQAFYVDDTELTSSPYRNSITINAWYGGDYSYIYYFNVFFEKEATITGVRFVGTDTTKYFKDQENVFRVPTYQVEISYSDGSVEVKNINELDISFYDKNKISNNNELIPNETIITSDVLVGGIIGNRSYPYFEYNITLVDVEIESVVLSGFNSIGIGSTLEDYENIFKATLTLTDGTQLNNIEFSFEDNDLRKKMIMDSSTLPSKLNVIIGRNKYEIDTPTTFTQPDFDQFVMGDRVAIKDFTKLSLNRGIIQYSTKLTNNKSKVFDCETDIKTLKSKNNLLDVDELLGRKIVDNNAGTYEVEATVDDVFREGTERTSNFNVIVKDASSMTSWTLKNIKQDYKVGDKFLEDDDTEIEFGVEGIALKQKLAEMVADGLFLATPQPYYEFKKVEENREVKITTNFGKNESQSYFISVSQANVSTTNNSKKIRAVFIDWEVALENVHLKKKKDFWLLVDDSVVEANGQLKTEYKNKDIAEENSVDVYGYIKGYKWYVYGYLENVNDKSRNGRVVLFKDHYNDVYGSNNMVVKFPCYVEGNADKINKSTFGIMFGADNYNNRLFVSGNSDYQNRDWHTADITGAFNEEYDNESENNLTYFPDVNEQQYGSSDTKVVGYDIVSDSKMLVLKEKSNKETTVYFRTPTYNEDDSGNINEVFTVSKGNNSVAGISPHSIINFNGDTLFIDSDNTLQGLDLVGIQGDTQRYANSRSKLIDNKLKDYDLSNSILWTNQKYLYLTVDGLGTFITHYETKGDSQYEWWLVDYDSPQAFIEIGGITYYGNNKGEFFKINKNSFVDIHKVFIKKGEGIYITRIYPDDNVEEIVLSERIIEKVKEGDKFKHYISEDYTKNIYKRVCSIGSEDDFDLKVENGLIIPKLMSFKDTDGKTAYRYPVNEKDAYFLNMHCNTQGTVAIKWEGHETDFGVPFYFKYKYIPDPEDEDVEKQKTIMVVEMFEDEDRTRKVDVSNLICADVCLRVEKDTSVSTFNDKEGTIKLEDNSNIVAYGIQDQQVDLIRGEISHIDNVKAYYITSPLLANIQYTKTLWDFTLTNDSGLPSELQLGVAKNKMPKKPSQFVSYSATDFDYDEVDYNTLTFESIEIPRVFTRHKVMPKLKFVCFALMNENDTNCVLTSMAITYTIPFPQV